MLLSVPVESIKGHFNGLLANATSVDVVIACEKCINVTTINTDEVRFYYPLNGSNASLSLIEADEEIADIKTAADVTASPYDQDTEAINFLDEPGGTTTANLIPWSSFLFAIASSTTGESYMYYERGGQVKKQRIDYTLAELVTLATP